MEGKNRSYGARTGRDELLKPLLSESESRGLCNFRLKIHEKTGIKWIDF